MARCVAEPATSSKREANGQAAQVWLGPTHRTWPRSSGVLAAAVRGRLAHRTATTSPQSLSTATAHTLAQTRHHTAHTRWITCGGRDLAHHARPCRHDHLVRAAVQRASRARHRACSAHPFLASPSARDFAHPVAVVRPLGQAWAEIERSAARGCTRAPGPHPAPSRRSDECGAMPLLCRCCASPSACSGRRRPGREYCEQPCSASG